MLITDRKAARHPIELVCRRALEGGADAIQIREKDLAERELFELACTLRRLLSGRKGFLIINHSVDVALASRADGVHLGWRSLGAADVRRLVGNRMLIGVSVHSIGEGIRAQDEGADYVQFGPIFPTKSKMGLVEPKGLGSLSALKRQLSIPVIAVGGIKPENVRDVIAAGADGVAVISAIVRAEDSVEAASELRRRMES